MNVKYHNYILIIILLVITPFASDELRRQLDSLDYEKQERRRQGRPLGDLEAMTASLQDSLTALRGSAPLPSGAFGGMADDGAGSGGIWGWIETLIPEGTLTSFKPRGVFDWIVVGTGCVAVLSGLTLILGIVATMGRRRRPDRVIGRKINLAPTRTQVAVSEFAAIHPEIENDVLPPTSSVGKAGGYSDTPAPKDTVADLQNLMETLRKIAPPPAPVPVSAKTPPEPEQNPPLIVNAPEPPPIPAAKRETPSAPSSDGVAPLPSFNELVLNAAKSGMSELEISRRYQLSVDLVKLILRMSKSGNA